jgi:hypothetical protein
MKEQSYSSHRRYVPGFHFVTGTLILVLLALSIINLVQQLGTPGVLYTGVMPVLVAVILFMLFLFTRQFAMKVQDRAIHAEEGLRHYTITQKPLDSRLTRSQVIALRFAPDEEFVELAQKAVAENMSSDDIKKAIKAWRADHHRA